MSLPVFSIIAAICNVFPPSPAHASIILSFGLARRKVDTICEPTSCISKKPSAKAFVLKTLEFLATSKAISFSAIIDALIISFLKASLRFSLVIFRVFVLI